MLHTLEQLRLRRSEILNITDKWGAYNVRVFGSFARGEADEDSDIDLLVNLKPGFTLMDLGGLLMDLQEFLGRKIDATTDGGLHWYIKDKILKEAVKL
ncbi:MAG: nucleotidyltransferase family protein [Candidatus Eremiobacteraeota bacterium]|nr:nucleotidyltransferase family protein [Candidatus Eremiobacteraeota bacterium]